MRISNVLFKCFCYNILILNNLIDFNKKRFVCMCVCLVVSTEAYFYQYTLNLLHMESVIIY